MEKLIRSFLRNGNGNQKESLSHFPIIREMFGNSVLKKPIKSELDHLMAQDLRNLSHYGITHPMVNLGRKFPGDS